MATRDIGKWSIKIDVWESPVVYASTRDCSSLYGAIRSEPETAAQSSSLRPAGGVNHPDSLLAKVGKLPAKKALR